MGTRIATPPPSRRQARAPARAGAPRPPGGAPGPGQDLWRIALRSWIGPYAAPALPAPRPECQNR